MVERRAPRTASPKAALSSRLGDVLARRRESRQTERSQAYASTKVQKPGQAEVVAIHANETPLSDILEKSRYEVRPARTGDYIHVSDLLSKCVRKIAIVNKFDVKMNQQNLSLTDSLTFGQGDIIHDVIKARTARGGPAKVWGNWECKCGTTKTKEPCLLSEAPEGKCSACQGPINIYQEVPMRDKDLMIVGTPDLILYLALYDAFHITELKSIAHERWKELVRPLPEHVMQVLFYWFLMERKGFKLTNRVSILYVTKGWMFSGAPYKEFTIDAVKEVKRLAPYLEDAKALLASRAGGTLPLRTCPTEQAPEAKKCEACRICFRGKDEDSQTISIRSAVAPRATLARRK